MTTDEWQAIRISVQVAVFSVLLCLPGAIGCAWLFARHRFYGKLVLETLANLPLVLPPVVTGYVLLAVFGRRGIVGGWLESAFGIQIVFDWKGAAIASAIVAFPLMVRAIRVSFEAIDPRLENAAKTLGARPLDAFLTISLPLARRGIIAGCLLGFARSLGEFGATIMIAGNIPGQTQTIPLFIYNLLEMPNGMQQALRLVWCSIAIAAVTLAGGEWINRQKPEN
ncbi:MAG: molybdate ABC transporter permease subunit [Planctomycetota bacterium]